MNSALVESVLLGAIAAASLAIGIFFLKYWRSSRDRFHLMFAGAFLLDALNRAGLGVLGRGEFEPFHYAIRLFSYVLILAAIIDKNRSS